MKPNRKNVTNPSVLRRTSDPAQVVPNFEEKDFASALQSVGAVAGRAMVCRTQRLIREHAIEAAEHRRRVRHAVGLAILGFSLLLLALTPVVWSSIHLASGWHFTDVESQSMYVLGWLFPVTLTGLVLAFMRIRAGRGTRRIDHRVESRLGSMVR